MASSPVTSWQIDEEKVETVTDFFFFLTWVPKSLQMVIAAMKLKDACSLEEKLKLIQHVKKERHHFANKSLSSQSCDFSSSPVQM